MCGRDDRLHCHEIWQHNPQSGYQWLRGFQALCSLCHGVKHITFVRDAERREELLRHFMQVNRLTPDQAREFLRDAQRLQRQLDQRRWVISYGEYNVRMPALADRDQRRQYVRSSRPGYRC